MSQPAPDLAWLADLSRFSMTPDPKPVVQSTTPATKASDGKLEAPSTEKELKETKKLEQKTEREEATQVTSPFQAPSKALSNVVSIMPALSSGVAIESTVNTELNRISSKRARPGLIAKLREKLAAYAKANRGFYGSGAAATTSACMRGTDIIATGSPGILLAALFWFLTLILGQELDRLRKLIEAEEQA